LRLALNSGLFRRVERVHVHGAQLTFIDPDKLTFIDPDKPTQNVNIESFNGRFWKSGYISSRAIVLKR